MNGYTGDWRAVDDGGWRVRSWGTITIASIHYPSNETPARRERKASAHARLIAAAPDMLKALKGVLRVADRKTDEFDAARAAIAKAESTTTQKSE